MNEAHSGGMRKTAPYLTVAGAWALAFGCAVGWGSFVMPGGVFLPIAGPVGSALGLGLGALVMLLLAANFHYLMNRWPDGGGTYTYTKLCFGYDHGLLSAWFLIITYVAVIWANATALPLIARTLFGPLFQFGFHYELAGFHVWFGEILLAVGALALAALACLRRTLAERMQIVFAALLLGGVLLCFGAAAGRLKPTFSPAFSPEHTPFGGTFTIFALAPWAYVGFESITHSAHESSFSLKKSFAIMAVALVTAGLAYALLALLAAAALPEGCASWIEYLARLDGYSGVRAQPTFFGAWSALGGLGSAALGLAALGGIVTGLIGNYVALSRLVYALAADGLAPSRLGELDDRQVPRNAILLILGVSVVLPFFGRTAISWIVDVTTVGATIAYAFASACALREARQQKKRLFIATGLAGLIVSLLFALEFLIPNLIAIKTLSTQSYLILAAWGILGLLYFRRALRADTARRIGRSIVAWVVLLGLIIFTSTVWMLQYAQAALDRAGAVIDGDAVSSAAQLRDALRGVDAALTGSIAIHTALIVTSLIVLFDIYSTIQKRERRTEVEKALAEESSRAKTSFLSNMSHEIRTPMNAIIGLDNIALRDPDLSPRTREHLEKIGASAKHLLGLINDILDMSRIESGRMVLKNEEFSFREFLDQINIMINGQCVDKGLQYRCDIIGRVSDYYYGDDLKLKQVLINILGNAVKFTNAPGDVTLSVEQTAVYEGRCAMRFVIRDTGIGMDASYIPKIFESFSQEDATTTNRYGGSGLGMAITRSFVQMMDGDILVESQKGVGSTFTVTVTLGASSRSFALDTGVGLPEDLRALVVDDDPIACEHAQVVLRAIGIEADILSQPDKALEALHSAWEKGQPYRLLLTDYKMPGMTGLELTVRLRAFDANRTAVFLLTGYNWDIIDEDARANGVDGIISKPVFTDSLMRQIHDVLLVKDGHEIAALPAAQEIGSVLAGRRVLMAEDVEQNAEILEDLLDLEDVTGEHAENGEIAVSMFAESPVGYYDAILMDVRMPVMDGLAATRAIRAMDRPDAKTVPIIAMTANVFDEDVRRSLQAGMNAHLSKPVEPERLYETMASLIGKGENA